MKLSFHQNSLDILKRLFCPSKLEVDDSSAGENPYRYIAYQLDVLGEMDEAIKSYLDSDKSSKEYAKLIKTEVKLLNRAYKAKYKNIPKCGDIEALLPNSTLTEPAKKSVPQLLEKDIRISVVSSGFDYLTRQITTLGVDLDDIHSNSFEYDENGISSIDIKVSGNKKAAIDHAIEMLSSKHRFSLNSNVAYVDDNNWGKPAIEHVISKGGYCFYLRPSKEKDKVFPIKDSKLENNPRFIVIKDISEIPGLIEEKYPFIKSVIFDADGTLIDVG